MKFSIMQKIWLLFAMVAYAGFLICFYQKTGLGVLCCGVSSAVFFLLVLLRGTFSPSDLDDDDMDDAYHDKYNFDALLNQSTQRREKLEAAEDQLEASGARILSLEQENQFYKKKVETFDSERDALQLELDNARARLVEMENKKHSMAGALLPDAKRRRDENVDLAQVAQEAIDKAQVRTEAAGIRVQVVQPQEPIFVHADRSLMERIFDCLIDNAVKYMRRKGLLQITLSSVGGKAFVVVKDNGEGLDSAEADRIFDLNFRGSNSTGGNGLGLTQVRAIVEAYGGSVNAKSKPGKGMGIYLQLPEVFTEGQAAGQDDAFTVGETFVSEDEMVSGEDLDMEDYTLF